MCQNPEFLKKQPLKVPKFQSLIKLASVAKWVDLKEYWCDLPFIFSLYKSAGFFFLFSGFVHKNFCNYSINFLN